MMTSRSRLKLFRALLASVGFVGVSLGSGVLHAQAGEADIVGVAISQTAQGVSEGVSEGVYRFDVSVSHADTGWEHYANGYEVLDLEGNVLATRVLMHPHVNERPFTRSLSGVQIPQSMMAVRVRAVDSVHGTGGQEFLLEKIDGEWQVSVFQAPE